MPSASQLPSGTAAKLRESWQGSCFPATSTLRRLTPADYVMPSEIAADRQGKQADKACGPLLRAASPAAGRPLYPTRAGEGKGGEGGGSLWRETAALPLTLYGREVCVCVCVRVYVCWGA